MKDTVLQDKLQKVSKDFCDDLVQKSDALEAFIATMARFHRYSPANVALILFQCPDAVLVSSYTLWRSLGRQVRHGEHALWIWAPMSRRKAIDENTGEIVTLRTGFRMVPVFDLSQTDGDDLPDMFDPIDGMSVQDMATWYGAMIAATQAEGRATVESPMDFVTGGYTDASGDLHVNSARDVFAKAQVLIHEWAHQVLHHFDERKSIPTRLKEAEAGAVLFVVAKALFGEDLDTAKAYVQDWIGQDPEALRASLATIQKAAYEIILATKEHYC